MLFCNKCLFLSPNPFFPTPPIPGEQQSVPLPWVYSRLSEASGMPVTYVGNVTNPVCRHCVPRIQSTSITICFRGFFLFYLTIQECVCAIDINAQLSVIVQELRTRLKGRAVPSWWRHDRHRSRAHHPKAISLSWALGYDPPPQFTPMRHRSVSPFWPTCSCLAQCLLRLPPCAGALNSDRVVGTVQPDSVLCCVTAALQRIGATSASVLPQATLLCGEGCSLPATAGWFTSGGRRLLECHPVTAHFPW